MQYKQGENKTMINHDIYNQITELMKFLAPVESSHWIGNSNQRRTDSYHVNNIKQMTKTNLETGLHTYAYNNPDSLYYPLQIGSAEYKLRFNLYALEQIRRNLRRRKI